MMKLSNNMRILVVGDLMLDTYLYGTCSRVSPEAPVPVVRLNKIVETLGGAANTINNIVGLGVKPFIYGVVGEDAAGTSIIKRLSEELHLDTSMIEIIPERLTTTKKRIVANDQHVVRLDNETTIPIENTLPSAQYDVIVVSDYGKGVVTLELLDQLSRMTHTIIIDPCVENVNLYALMMHWKYSPMNILIIPNSLEAESMSGEKIYELGTCMDAADILQGTLEASILITRGAEGMVLCTGEEKYVIPATKVAVFDVSGAGDTVAAVMAVGLGSGMTNLEAATLANKAAGIVVNQSGTTAINLKMLGDEWQT